MYMLDTNTVSYFFRQEPTVVKKLQQLNPEVICISSVTAAELFYGVKKRNNQKLSDLLTTFLSAITVLDWNYQAAEVYRQLRADMEREGKIMGVQDQMIGAHALATECVLVSSDKAFQLIPNLVLENWQK